MIPRFHRAISINTLCLEDDAFGRHVDTVARIGACAISPTKEAVADFGVAASARALDDAGLSVATLTHRAFGFATPALSTEARERLDQTIDLAAAIGAASITLTTGGRGDLPWQEAATRFAEAIAPCAERAASAGVRLAIEPTSHLYADASIAHRLGDTLAIARQAGIALGVDIFACWFDSDIEQTISEAGAIAALVQVSDYVAGDRSLPCRAVPGDGIVPLERLIGLLVSAGCSGPFDLEIIGPRLTAEGREIGLRRAAATVGDILDRSGLER